MVEFFVIVCVFAGVLAVFLYFYLLKDKESRWKNNIPNKVKGELNENFEEEVAKRLDSLFQEADMLEEKVTTIHDYVKEVVKTRRKK